MSAATGSQIVMYVVIAWLLVLAALLGFLWAWGDQRRDFDLHDGATMRDAHRTLHEGITAQIIDAEAAFAERQRASGEEPAGTGNAAAGSPHPSGSRTAIAATGSPDDPQIEQAVTRLFHRHDPRKDAS